MFRFPLPATLAALFLLCLPMWSAAMTLVKDGQPTATIVVSAGAMQARRYNWAQATPDNWAKPAEKVRAAAEELQRYLEKISGAKLPIADDATEVKGAVVCVGVSGASKKLPVFVPQGVTKDFREEGMRIYGKGDVLLLAGNDAGPYHGTEYAVCEFLFRLGARWYMPGDYGEYLPALKTVAVDDLDVSEMPDFPQRTWWTNQTPEMAQASAEFKLHNKMNPQAVIAVAGDGSLDQWLPDAAMQKTHPEYFGKRADGTLNPIMPNLTNPDVPALIAEKMKATIKKQIDNGVTVPQVAIAPDDGMPMDFTPETMKTNLGFFDLGGRQGVPTDLEVSEEWFTFVNKVAELVTKDYPNALILSNGYANRNMPPEGITLHPNLGIEFAAIWADSIHAFTSPVSWQSSLKGNLLQRWCRMNSRVYLYDYDEQMLVTGLTPVPGVRKVAANMPLMKKWRMAGFLNEMRDSYMEEGIQTKYLRARMMWDAGLKVEDVLTDYYSHWYGAAAVPARAFWDALEDAMEQTPLLGHEDRVLPFVYTPALLATLEGKVAEAERLAADDRSKAHVRADRLILDHLKAYMAMHDAEFGGRYGEAIKQAEAMLACRVELEKLSPFYCKTKGDNIYTISGESYWGITARKAHYQKLEDLTNGKTGTLLAMAPKAVQFALDPADLGRFERWYLPEYDRKGWQLADTCKPYYLQAPGGLGERNIPYQGAMWYVFELNVPANAKGKPVTLYAPIVVDDAWVWVNGTFVGHRGHIDPYIRPAEVQYDITALVQPGKKNVIGVRVSTGLSPSAVADGFMGRLFLYSPVK